jgi:UDP-3-O-[3-hydroxymyristoyl] glucosamine N-acyltransferase
VSIEPVTTSLGQLASVVQGELVNGDPAMMLKALAGFEQAQPGQLSFLSNKKWLGRLPDYRGSALMISNPLVGALPATLPAIVVPDAYLAYAVLSQWIKKQGQARPAIHPGAWVDSTARIGSNTSIGPGAVVGEQVVIGENTRIAARVVIEKGCVVGNNCIIHAGTVIGSDGFGFAPSKNGWVKIEQLGAVIIGDDVEIGANCTIDRGAMDNTVIGRGCKLDNLIQIAHNVVLGEHCAIAGCVGIAGSAVIGNRVQIGGGAGILGHLKIADDVIISSMTLVPSSITEPGFYSGVYPIASNRDWEKSAAALRQLPEMRRRLRQLEQKFPKEPT